MANTMSPAEELLGKMTARLRESFMGAIEMRLRNMVAAGISIQEISLRHNHADGKTTICVRNVADSEFWIEHGHSSITVRGESAK